MEKLIWKDNEYQIIGSDYNLDKSKLIGELPKPSFGKEYLLSNGTEVLISNTNNWRIFFRFEEVEIYKFKTSLESFFPCLQMINQVASMSKHDLIEKKNEIITDQLTGLSAQLDALNNDKKNLISEIKKIKEETIKQLETHIVKVNQLAVSIKNTI